MTLFYGVTLSFISHLAQEKCHLLAYGLKYVIILITIKPVSFTRNKKIIPSRFFVGLLWNFLHCDLY